jgi:WD40 repeat protein
MQKLTFLAEMETFYGTMSVEVGLLSVSVSSDRSYIAASSDDGVYLFKREGSLIWKYIIGLNVSGVSVSSDGSYIAVGSLDNKVYFFNREGDLL